MGTDKAKVPGLVHSFATKLGSAIASPKEDLKVDEKKKIAFCIKNHGFDNEHERDALASALFAYNQAKALLGRIDNFARDNNKHQIQNRIKEIVIRRKISIKSAVSLIEGNGEEERIMEKAATGRALSENDFLRLYDKLKKCEEEISLVKRYNNKLLERLGRMEKTPAQAHEKAQKAGDKTDIFRENRIRFLERALKLKNKNIDEIRLMVKGLSNKISCIDDFYVLKKLNTLGSNEFGFKSGFLNIKRNDILLVDNVNALSLSVIDALKNKVFMIVHKKPISKSIENSLPFVFLHANGLNIEEYEHFGFVEKGHFEMQKGRIDWFRKVIEDYKLEKANF